MTVRAMERGAGNVLGFEVSGDVTKADYDLLIPAVAAAVEQHGTVRLLLDLTGFRWEKVGAWGADLRFGREFHDKIERLAIVGEKGWERHLATICSPFYAKESEYFDNDPDAWAWLEG